MSDPDGTKGQTLEELIERYESGQPARDGLEQAEYDHLAACADEPEEETRAETEAEAAAADHFLHELREAGARTDQARLSGDASRIASAQQAEWDLTQAAIDEAAEKEPEAGQ